MEGEGEGGEKGRRTNRLLQKTAFVASFSIATPYASIAPW